LATDWGRVSSTASPSAVETDLEVFLKRRQWVLIRISGQSFDQAQDFQPSAWFLHRDAGIKLQRHIGTKQRTAQRVT